MRCGASSEGMPPVSIWIRTVKSPSLVVVAGPLKGAVVALGEEKLSIGRDPANRLCVGDLALSRRHCVIEPSKSEGDPYTLRDLESLNGTFINGVPVNERALEHGDLICVGDSVIIFLLHRDAGRSPLGPDDRTRPVEEDRALVGSTIKLSQRESRYPPPDETLGRPVAPSRAARDWNALLRISAALHAVRGVESLQRKLLELILEVVPAESAAILLGEEGDEEFASTVSYGSSSAARDYTVPVSRPLVQQAMREGVAVLTTEAVDSGSARESSGVSGGARSALCAPLTVREHAAGVIYLTSGDPAIRCDEDHLQYSSQ
jgi:pSer/pThr/pTyr-binding forkhead associated (FHA) protein